MPKEFKERFSCTWVIIDATEFPLEIPSNPDVQAATWSNYKNRNTLKLLVGVSPNGVITFLSPLYGGRISDKELTQRSNLLSLLWRMPATRCARTKCSNRTTCQQSGMPERQYLEPTRSRAELRIDVSMGDRVMSNHAGVRIGGDRCKANGAEWVRFGAWNVRSLRGSEEELVEEMIKYRLEVLGVSETKLKGNGARAVGEGMCFFWSSGGESEGWSSCVSFKEDRQVPEGVEMSK